MATSGGGVSFAPWRLTSVAVVVTYVAAYAATDAALLPVILAGAALTGVLSLVLVAPRAAVLVVLAVLPAVGVVRRLTSTNDIQGTAAADVFVLLPAAVTGALLLATTRAERWPRRRSMLGTSVLVLAAFTALGTLNPLQGPFAVGAGGLILQLTPLCWFWIGRAFVGPREMPRAVQVIAAVGTATACYGLYQVFVGFPPFELQYLAESGRRVAALSVGSAIRPFSSFTSASEFALYLGCAAVAIYSRGLPGRVISASASVLVLAALVLESARAALVLTVLALAFVATRRRVSRAPISLIVMAATVAATVAFAQVYSAGVSTGNKDIDDLLDHQLQGLADPFNSEKSTLVPHLQLLVEGLTTPFRYPLGVGTGAVTTASGRFGGSLGGAETDLGNVALSLGFPGLLAFICLLFGVVATTRRVLRRGPARTDLFAVGILIVTAGQWLNGGNYAVAVLPWLALGYLDARDKRQATAHSHAASESGRPRRVRGDVEARGRGAVPARPSGGGVHAR